MTMTWTCDFCRKWIDGGRYHLPDDKIVCPECYDTGMKKAIDPTAAVALYQLRFAKYLKKEGI